MLVLSGRVIPVSEFACSCIYFFPIPISSRPMKSWQPAFLFNPPVGHGTGPDPVDQWTNEQNRLPNMVNLPEFGDPGFHQQPTRTKGVHPLRGFLVCV